MEAKEQLQYELVIDTAKAERQVQTFSEQAGETIAGKTADAAPAADATPSAETPKPATSGMLATLGQDTLNVIRRIAIPAATLLNASGFLASVTRSIAQSPLSGLTDGIGSAGKHLSDAGEKVGGPFGGAMVAVGKFVEAMGKVTGELLGMAQDLSDYSPVLFDTFTRLELVFEGLKYELAYALGPQLSALADQMADLVIAVMPDLAAFLKGLTALVSALWKVLGPLVTIVARLVGALGPVLELLALLAEAVAALLKPLMDLLTVLVDVVKGVTGWLGQIGNAIGDAFKWMGERAGDAWNWVTGQGNGMAKGIGRVADNTEAMKQMMLQAEGLAMSGGLFYAMAGYAENQSKIHVNRMAPQPQRDPVQGDAGVNPQQVANGQVPAPAGPRGNAAVDFVRGGGNFPRPAPAALNFRVADAVNVQAADEDRLIAELGQLRQFVVEQLRGQHDARWLRLAGMRNAVKAALI